MTWPVDLYSPAELATLTGYIQKAKMRDWLDLRGVAYITNRDGFPLVRREALAPAQTAAAINLGALAPRRRKAA